MYADGFSVAEDDNDSVLFEFQSAWGGNIDAPFKLTKIKLFKDCVIHYTTNTDGGEDEIDIKCINGVEHNN